MIKILKDKNRNNEQNDDTVQMDEGFLTDSYDKNIERIKHIFQNDDMIIFREIKTRGMNPVRCCVVFTDGMTEARIVNDNIIGPILNTDIEKMNLKEERINTFIHHIIASNHVQIESDVNELVSSILYGNTILFIENEPKVLIIETKGGEARDVTRPVSEPSVRGPQEAFTESIMTNITLIRKKIINPDLKFQFEELGSCTKTKICICYLEEIVNEKILKELHQRLSTIDLDGIIDSSYIEELIKDSPLSPFSTIGSTERPDVGVAQLLEGKIVLICDGSPFVLTLPYLFIEYFQSNEDYYQSFIYGSINRMLKIIAFFLTTSIPAIYVALTTFHQEMIPTALILSISAARQDIPFPTIVEAFGMLFAFELIREGGIRLPTPMGATISFVGALIIGEATVRARIVSAPIVIIVAITGVTAYLIPKLLGGIIVTRTIFLLLSAFLGLYGYIFGVIGLFIHLMSMRSFGVPYMLNIGGHSMQDIKDTAIRAPWWVMQYRPKLIAQKNRVRQTDGNARKKEKLWKK